ncbi:apolipoprotein N-acyltransferase [Candidatus Zixiibacteriota bacterium]
MHSILARPVIRLAVLAALILFAYPPFPFGFLAWLIPAFVLGLLDRASIRDSFRYAWWFGFCMHLGLLYWAAWVSFPGMLAVAAVLGAYIGIVFALYAFIRRGVGPAAIWFWPVLWVAHEYLRGLGVLGFPWTNLSYTQTNYVNLIQTASVTGDLGVSLWVAYLNVLLFQLWRNRANPRIRLALIGIFCAMIILPFLYGKGEISRIDYTPREVVTATVLQGDIDSYQKWDSAYVDFSFATYHALSYLAGEQTSDLIIWPETAVPGYLRANTSRLRELQALSREVHTPILLGTLEYRTVGPGQYVYYNAAHQAAAGRLGPQYHAKLQLVPMGEWIPFSDRVKILKDIHVGQADFTAGHEYVLFDHPQGPYAALICFESAFPELARNFVRRGARFLVNITNDGWYGFTPGPYQHAHMCVMRAIENRIPLARSANSGISMFVDRVGRIGNASDQFIPDLRIDRVALREEITLFTRYGMWVGRWCVAVTIVLFMLVVARAATRKSAKPDPIRKVSGVSRPNATYNNHDRERK